MGKWKTRTDGSAAQIGNRYQEEQAAYPYGAKRRGSGQDLAPQPRSVDSMKSPLVADMKDEREDELAYRKQAVAAQTEHERKVLTGIADDEADHQKKLKALSGYDPKANQNSYGEYVAESLHDGHGHNVDIVRINKPAHQVDLKLTSVNVDELASTQISPDLEKRSDYFVDAIQRGQTIPPILVHQLPDGSYQVIDGHARVRAYQKMGIKKVPAVENGLSDVLAKAGLAIGKGVKVTVVEGARTMGEATRAYGEGLRGKKRKKPKPESDEVEENS